MANGLGMSGGDGGEGGDGGGEERSVVMTGGRGACVASGNVSKRDCCRLPGIIRELWKDLQYSFPFFINFFFNMAVPLVGMERMR